MSRSRRQLVRDYIALSGGELVSKLAGFAAFAYLARTLSPDSYGAVELAVALAMFFTLVVDFGFGPIGARELIRAPERAPELAAAIPAARIGITVLAILAMAACATLLDPPRPTRMLILIYAASLLAAPWNLNWLLQGLDLLPWVSLAQAARMIVFALGVLLVVSSDEDLWRVGLVEGVAAATMAGYYLWIQRRRIAPLRLGARLGLVRHLTREAVPVGLGRILWAWNQYVATVLVAVRVGGAEIAWFGAAHRVVTSLGSFVYLYHFNLYPQVVRAASGGGPQLGALFGASFRVTAWLGVGVGLGGTLLAEPVCRFIFGAPFAAAAPALAVLSWILPASLLGSHARFTLIAYGHQRSELAANATGAVVVLALGMVLVGRLGALGAAIAMLVSTIATWAVAQLMVMRRVEAIPFLLPLARPALAAGGAAAAFVWLDSMGPLGAAVAALVLYGVAAPLLQPKLVEDVRGLLGEDRVGSGPGPEPLG